METFKNSAPTSFTISFVAEGKSNSFNKNDSHNLLQQTKKTFPLVSGVSLAKTWNGDKQQNALFVGMDIDGGLYDLDRNIEEIIDAFSSKENATQSNNPQPNAAVSITIFDKSDERSLFLLRHSATHLMAHAIQNLFPGATFATGPVIENGYYYDVDFSKVENLAAKKLSEEDFPRLEKEMLRLAKQKHPNSREVMSKEEALRFFTGHPYKQDILKNLSETETISIYRTGHFTDLCRGPHIAHTAPIKHFKLLRIAGAYWKGDEKNPMLTRVYGTAFWTKHALKAYFRKLKEAESRDHNKLGRSLGFFHTDEIVGQGLPLLTPKGTILFNVLKKYVEEIETSRGYEHTLTPYLAKSDLYKVSGHWQLYRDGMFVMDSQHGEFALRPMTCPFHFSLYNATRHSYRELPVRYAETSTLFRNEASGEMHGLIRVRQFTLADGHIICAEAQIEKEFEACIDLLGEILHTIGLDNYTYRLSKWDPAEKGKKYIDNPQAWEYTENKMRDILTKRKLPFVEAAGEAAFYGPKLDIQMKNVFGKEDTILTVQIDFAMPERFEMFYIDENDQKTRPYVIHRSSIGCYERTMALLIEHYAGKFPFWMAITQIGVLSINEKTHDYAAHLFHKLKNAGFRAKLDTRGESLGKKIKQATAEKIPILLTIGEREKENENISFRTYDNVVVNGMDFESFLKTIQSLEKNRSKTLPFHAASA